MMMKQKVRSFPTAILCALVLFFLVVPQATQASLVGTTYDVALNAVIEVPGSVPPFGIEMHTVTGLNFDGLTEPLPSTGNVRANGFDLETTDTVSVTGPMSESVLIEVSNPLGGSLVNGDLSTAATGPTNLIFDVTNLSWGTGAGIAEVSNVELSFVDAAGNTNILAVAPVVTGDGTTTPLGFSSTIPNADLENGFQGVSLSFDVAHPVPEPASVLGLLLGLPLLAGRERRRANSRR